MCLAMKLRDICPSKACIKGSRKLIISLSQVYNLLLVHRRPCTTIIMFKTLVALSLSAILLTGALATPLRRDSCNPNAQGKPVSIQNAATGVEWSVASDDVEVTITPFAGSTTRQWLLPQTGEFPTTYFFQLVSIVSSHGATHTYILTCTIYYFTGLPEIVKSLRSMPECSLSLLYSPQSSWGEFNVIRKSAS